MSTPNAFADDAAETYAELCDRMEAIRPGGITEDELPEYDAIMKGWRHLQPTIEEEAVTFRLIGQLSRAGATRAPLPPMRREIVDLIAYQAQRWGIPNIVSFWAKISRVSADTKDAA